MKKFFEEFKAFIARGNVLDMAVGVIVAGAFSAITTALVSNVITPLLAWAFGSPNTDALNITLRAADEAAGQEAIVLGLGTLVGAIITERVYLVPGAGNLLTNAINANDNGVIVGLTLFYALLSIVSLILGDVLMATVDPSISFSTSKVR